MCKEPKLIEVSVICEKFDVGLIKFVSSLSSSKKISVKTIIVAPSLELHPLRSKQISIRKEVFDASGVRQSLDATKLIGSLLAQLRIKSLVLRLIARFKKYSLGFKVIQANEDWSFSDTTIYKDMAVLYSFEGLLTEDVISKFGKGIINIHPAVLPGYRGLDGSLWALYEGATLGVSAYKVDVGIDTGPIIKIFKLKKMSRTLPDYILDLKKLKYESYVESIVNFDAGIFENIDPQIDRAQNRGVMPKIDVERLLLDAVFK